MPLAYIKFVDPRTGRPIDPGFGQGEPGGPVDPGFGNRPDSPGIDNDLPWAPVVPGYPIMGPPRPWPPLPWPPRPFPPGPTDPDWGVGGGGGGNFPIYIPGDSIDNTLPPFGEHKPLPDPPPGTIWPPIPGVPEGKYAVLVWIIGIGWRYAVVEAPAPPDAGTKPIEPPSTKPITPPPATPK